MTKYGYFIVVPIDPTKIDRIFKDCRDDEEKIDAVIKYVVQIIKGIWKKDKKLLIIQTELTQTNRKKEVKA